MVGARIRITDNPQAEKPQDIIKKRPASASKDEPPSSKSTLPRPTPPAPLPPPMTLLGGLRRGYVPVRRRNPSGGLQSSGQISPSDGTRRRQLRGRDRQAEEEDGEAGMTEAGMTEAGVTEAGVTEAGKSKTSPELYYNGGAVIVDPVVYLIYYGTWPENSGAAVIENFVQSLGGNASRQGGPRGESSVSDWWAITTHYFMTRADRKLAYVTPKVRFGGSVVDRGSIGHSFSDTEIARILPWSLSFPFPTSPNVQLSIATWARTTDCHVGKDNRLPSDPRGIDIVITSAGVPSTPRASISTPSARPPRCPLLALSPKRIFVRPLTYALRSLPLLSPHPPVVDRNVGKANRLPSDPSGIYIVITSADVDVWEFSRCSYCGWHAQMMDMRTGSPVAYAFVGHHSLCCQYSNSSPNGLPAIDSMVSTIAHEITEATTDSSPNGLPAIDSMLCRPKLCRSKLCRSKLCRPKLCRPKLCRSKLRCPKLCRPELCCPKLRCP
ncbi:unnamed protein product [Closterium sp. NIES-64]|nr:unnamed protein product [Closterium sp. NIES-64]